MVKHENNSWYETLGVSESLRQGDLLKNVPLLLPSSDAVLHQTAEIQARVALFDAVILTQSCDLEHSGKVTNVQLAPVYTLKEYFKQNAYLNKVDSLERIRKNQMPRYYMMNRNYSSLFLQGKLIVDFGSVFSIRYKAIVNFKNQAGSRISLRSPYKEQLSQQFARFYMRVGLPNDIEPFTKPIKVD